MFEKLRKKKEPKENPVDTPRPLPQPPSGPGPGSSATVKDNTSYIADIHIEQTGYKPESMKFRGFLIIYKYLNGRRMTAYSDSALGSDPDVLFKELEDDARAWLEGQKKVDSGVYKKKIIL